ncbi:MAG TPA: hypothetical protein VHU85_09125 [Acidimicrobiales bacterium]|jgi:hypothetical protein|nr:hypothetical protein [Acidimicrobiales bacterium]
MTTTIAQQVSHLTETMAAQPPNEVMGAFTREQADLAAKRVIAVGATLHPHRTVRRGACRSTGAGIA